MKIIFSSRRHHYVAIVSIFLVIVALIVGMVGCGCDGFEEEAVTFADSDLEAVVRGAIAIPEGPIYSSDLDGLTSLSASGKNIVDLAGLECCTSLTELGLHVNQISDISPLTNLASLTTLTLHENQISDISPLTNLASLTTLRLNENKKKDLSQLTNLTTLRSR